MKYPQLPLAIQNDIEQRRSFEGITNLHDILVYVAAHLSVDAQQLLQLQEVVYSDVQPTGSDSKKLWIKTEEPVAFGVPSGGGYVMIYKYPPNTPFLWTGGEDNIPVYCRKVSDGELSQYGFTKPKSTSVMWIIFEL